MNVGLIVRKATYGQHRIPRERLDAPLTRFAVRYGVDRLAADLGVTRQAVSYWLSGKNAPRPMHALRVVELSQRELSVEDVYRGFEDLRKRRQR